MPFFLKIFEKIIYINLLEFINANNILYEKQFGFRQGHATSHAIMTLSEKVTKALDTGKIVVGVYLDIRKAFDSISTSILLDKLYKIGIRGNICCLIQSYLSSRTQYVVYNKRNSSAQSIEYGVPQGSILGLLLFILFMNDFSKASKVLLRSGCLAGGRSNRTGGYLTGGRSNTSPNRKRYLTCRREIKLESYLTGCFSKLMSHN